MAQAQAAAADEKVWERIRRLEALAKSDNPNEAESARRLAQKLRKKHALPEGGSALPSDVGITWQPLLETGNAHDWAVLLAFAVAEAHGCLILVSDKKSRYAKYPYACRIVGSASDRRAAVLCWQDYYEKLQAFQRTQKLGRYSFGGKLVDAWMASETLRVTVPLRSYMSDEDRKLRLRACREAVMARRVDNERI